MDARLKALIAACGTVYLAACAPMTSRESPQHVSETEMLQKATSLAIGNLAWESVRVTEVSKENDKIKWVGLTRSVKYVCNADAHGENSNCERISLAPPPRMPGRGVGAQAGAREPQSPVLSRNNVSVAGVERSYFYYVSSKYRPDAYNYVVYALHDNGQTAQEFAQQSGWMKLAETNGFVVVFPECAEKSWAANSGGEDGYLKAVYDHVSRRLMIGGAPRMGAPVGNAEREGAAGGGRTAPPGHAGAGTEGGAGGGREAGGAGGAGGDREAGGASGAGGGREAEGAGGIGRGRDAEGAGEAAGGGPVGGARGGRAAAGAGGGQRVPTWPAFHYLTGVGAGATVAQEFVLNYPGVFAALATVDGGAYAAAYTRGEEPAQGYFQYLREGKNAKPVWKQLKKDVPVAAWLFSTGARNPAVSKLASYWRRADGAGSAGTQRSFGGFQTTVYRNPAHEVQQVRTTALTGTTKYDEALVSLIWSEFFEHVGRWPSSPNGDLASLLTQAEIEKTFEIRTVEIGSRSYKYYVKTPSSYRKGQSLPVVLAAHGAFFPITQYMNQIKMHEVGEKEGFITVYLNGYQNRWEFTDPDGPDAQFVLRAIDEVLATYGADKSRVYMQGFSLGSGLSYMMGISHSQVFAAVSPNSGIGPMSPQVKGRAAEIRKSRDLRIPTMIVYGDVDSAASTDGKIPAQGVLRGAIDEIKQLNKITTADRVERFDSPNTAPYDVLVPGGKPVSAGVDKRYQKGRFQITQYMSGDPRPLELFSFVWVTDLTHAADPRTAQLEWDYFKHWRRNADGSVTFSP